MLGLKVISKAISTSSPASLYSSPSTSFIGTSDEFFNFRAMSVSQAQNTIGEINSNSLWSSRTVRHVCKTEEKVSVPSAQCYGAVIYCEVWDGACDLTH